MHAEDERLGGPPYGRVRSPKEWGRLVRAERRRQGRTLAEVYEVSTLTTRFLSELERGKENASLGRALKAFESLGLDVLVVPRADAEALLRALRERCGRAGGAGPGDQGEPSP
jgi:HTH-type transcriptional regulator / antitoxin HipB